MKRMTGLLLAGAMLLSLCGCADKEALALGGRMLESMKDGSMSFSLSIRRVKDEEYAEAVVGTGTATGLLSEAMRLEATYYTETVNTITNSHRMPWGDTWVTRRNETRSGNHHLLHYRGGTLYFAKYQVRDPELPAFVQMDWGEVTLAVPESLRVALRDGELPAGVIGDVSVAAEGSGKALRCTIAGDSDLARLVAGVVFALDAVPEAQAGGEVSAVKAFVLVDEQGRLREMDLTVVRETFAGASERTLTVKAEGYGPVNPIGFPEYVK